MMFENVLGSHIVPGSMMATISDQEKLWKARIMLANQKGFHQDDFFFEVVEQITGSMLGAFVSRR